MDPATMAMMAQGLGSISEGMSAAPSSAYAGGSTGSLYVEGMQIPGQAAAGYSALVWPAVIGLVALVWLRK